MKEKEHEAPPSFVESTGYRCYGSGQARHQALLIHCPATTYTIRPSIGTHTAMVLNLPHGPKTSDSQACESWEDSIPITKQ